MLYLSQTLKVVSKNCEIKNWKNDIASLPYADQNKENES